MNKKNVRPLTAQEMENISGGCWLCSVWNWLKKSISGGGPVTYSPHVSQPSRIIGGRVDFTIDIPCCMTTEEQPTCLDKTASALAI